MVGAGVGEAVGVAVGTSIGDAVGESVGEVVGVVVGLLVEQTRDCRTAAMAPGELTSEQHEVLVEMKQTLIGVRYQPWHDGLARQAAAQAEADEPTATKVPALHSTSLVMTRSSVGLAVGEAVVGAPVGENVGFVVGGLVGEGVGLVVGLGVGLLVGGSVGQTTEDLMPPPCAPGRLVSVQHSVPDDLKQRLGVTKV